MSTLISSMPCTWSHGRDYNLFCNLFRIFCASTKGVLTYSTISYIQVVNQLGEVHCQMIMGKARAAPLKQMTILRLELSGATVATRVNNMINKELEVTVDKTVFWTDSRTVLCYIHDKSIRFNTFVANRLAVIHYGSSPSQWRYINSKDNPADD